VKRPGRRAALETVSFLFFFPPVFYPADGVRRVAVINLRAKITYGPQMPRRVFLRFPLFIRRRHRHRLRRHVHAERKKEDRVHVRGGGGEGGERPAGKPTIFSTGKKRRPAADLRRTSRRHPYRGRAAAVASSTRPTGRAFPLAGRGRPSHASGDRRASSLRARARVRSPTFPLAAGVY